MNWSTLRIPVPILCSVFVFFPPSFPVKSAAPILYVPFAGAPVEPAGAFRVETWAAAANTHALRDRDGRGAVPVSEARFLWGDGQLYVRFFASDLDLQVRATEHDGPVWNDDSVVLSFFPDESKRAIQVSPTGVVADGVCPIDSGDLGDGRCDLGWESGARVAADYDGTINEIGDVDEEWAVEIAVPLKFAWPAGAGPGSALQFAIRRCEMAVDGRRACGFWGFGNGGTLVLQGPSG
jgi:hypothetical protein